MHAPPCTSRECPVRVQRPLASACPAHSLRNARLTLRVPARTPPAQLLPYPHDCVGKIAARYTLPVRALSFAPGGATLAVGGDDAGIKLIDTAANRVGCGLRTVAAGGVPCSPPN